MFYFFGVVCGGKKHFLGWFVGKKNIFWGGLWGIKLFFGEVYGGKKYFLRWFVGGNGVFFGVVFRERKHFLCWLVEQRKTFLGKDFVKGNIEFIRENLRFSG